MSSAEDENKGDSSVAENQEKDVVVDQKTRNFLASSSQGSRLGKLR
eukprot:CAMPEP_0198118046 /NCGR_PEP_ID=MMETSP1442-20131203/20151_1 /TAXON_ID= /ORGANISM="Craspedostauros australis, Strain CCMP3328" /LENGTH=45 /DNA_ID= /DNA_START= /DNA_END= /DNA_ORIENTATION=